LSPCPTYHGCAGDILTPYIAAPHSTSSFSSSSDPDVASLIALPFSWAARGRLAGGLGDFLTRLHPLLVFPEETRVTPFPLSHLTHMAGRFLLHSCGAKSFCSLRTSHFRHRRIHMTDSTRYHHPSSSTSAGVSVAKCTWGMKKMSSPAAPSNVPPSVLWNPVVTVDPVSSCGPPTATLECVLRIPATLLELLPYRPQWLVSEHHSPSQQSSPPTYAC
jgi:hypothetical protein